MDYRRQLIQKYFDKKEWDRAYKVMMGESGGRSDAVGDTQPIRGVLAPSVGLFQIRTLPGRPSAEQLKDPEFNVKYAAQMQRTQGWRPWTVARNLGYANGGTTKRVSSQTMNKSTSFQEKSRKFAQEARKRGWPESQIQAFIDEKATVELGKRGSIKPEDISDESARLTVEEAIGTQPVVDKELQEMVDAVKSGLDLKDIPMADRARVTTALAKEGFKIPEELTADEKKKQSARKDLDNVITQLENTYYGAPGEAEDLAKGRVRGIGSFLGQMAGFQPKLKTYKNLIKSVRPTFARAAGDVGNLSESEQKAAIKALPSEFSTPQEALMAFKATRERFGLPSRDLGEIAGPGVGMFAVTLPKTSKAIESAKETPWESKDIAAQIGGPITGAIASKRYREEIVPAGLEVASAIGTAQAVKQIPKAIVSPVKKLATSREVAARTAKTKISGSTIAKAGRAYVKDDPLAEKYVEKILPTIEGKDLSPMELLRKTAIWNKAYSGASKVGKGAKAGFYDALAKAAKEELKKKAPEVAKYTRLLDLAYKGPRAVSRAVWEALKILGLGRVLPPL